MPATSLIERCGELKTETDFSQLREDLRQTFRDTDPTRAQKRLSSLNPRRQAAAFLELVGCGIPPEAGPLAAALRSDEGDLAAAAAFCLTCHWAQEEDWLCELLVGLDPFTAPRISETARFFVVRHMGLSQQESFSSILWKILTQQYHFYNVKAVAEALQLLGVRVDPKEVPPLQAPSVTAIKDGTILLGEDERFGGSSQCPKCRFFPRCRIVQEHHPGGIEDCRLFNRIDAAGFTIVEQRESRAPRDQDQEPHIDTEQEMKEIGLLLDQKRDLEAIPRLAKFLILTVGKEALVVPAWVRLSSCLARNGEEKLAYIALREAHACKEVSLQSFQAEHAALQGFDEDPRACFNDLSREAPMDRDRRLERRAIDCKRRYRFVLALDSYVEQNLLTGGKHGGNWFEMGECFQELGELALAELCMHLAAKRNKEKNYAEDPSLTLEFLKGAEAARDLAKSCDDPGIVLKRRRQERAETRESLPTQEGPRL